MILQPGIRHLRGRLATLVVGVAAVAALCVPASVASARLVWNATASAPIGLYYIEHDAWEVGDRVAVHPSAALAQDLDRRGVLPSGKLLIKRVAAARGDTVCRQQERVTVNGALAATARSTSHAGGLLPVWAGCMTLGINDVLLLGDTPESYDGRYFGVTSTETIVGRVIMVASL